MAFAEAHIKYKWSPHDLALWSNSAVNHLATWDFSGPREGDRAVVVGEKPVSLSFQFLELYSYEGRPHRSYLSLEQYYDENSTTWTGQVDVEGL